MSRSAGFAIGLLVVLAALVMMGQQQGGPGKRSTDTSIQDFKRAMAVQAAPDQISDYQSLAKNIEGAKRQAHDLGQRAGAAPDATGLYKPASALRDTVDQVQNDTQAFVKGFSRAQATLLKDFTKKLGKAVSEVTKENKGLDEQVKRSAIDPRQLADIAGRLEKALSDLQTQQHNLASEMGVPGV